MKETVTAPTDGFHQEESTLEVEKKKSQPFELEDSEYHLKACKVSTPEVQTTPVIFTSPHSGRNYFPQFLASSRLNKLDLRRSEDAFLDEVFKRVPENGAPLLCAKFPRAYVDVNREAFELDPTMFHDPLPNFVKTTSPRITAGLGTIAKIVTDGEEIYHAKISVKEALWRIENFYRPYHEILQKMIKKTKQQFGGCLLIDCHSMPHQSSPFSKITGKRFDIVLGNCFGRSCSNKLTNLAKQTLKSTGLSVILNKPYSGGFTTSNYGRPNNSVHVLQIEINRSLYMDEDRIRRGPGMTNLISCMTEFVSTLTKIDPSILND